MAVFAAVYSGIGTQWAGMGRELFAAEPAFAEGLREFDAAFKDMAGWSVEEYLYREAGDVAPAFRGHPCIVAVSLGLTALLRSRGFTPSLCVGHSGGEVAAACASGALDAKQAARVAREHSLILSRAGGSGKMLHLSLPGETAARLIAQTGGEARAAALNSPFSTVCSGPEDILSALAKRAEALAPGSTRFLRVDVPFHSPAIEHLLGDFSAGLGDLEAREPGIPLVSSLRGALADVSGRADFGRDYWVEHIRQPVRFADAMAAVLKLGYRRLVEISPHAVLQAAVTENASALGLDIASTALMARQTDSRDSCGAALAIMASWDKPVGRAGLTGPAAALAQLPPERRKNSLEELVLSRLGSLLARDGWSPADRGTPFQYLGLTSISALRLARGLTDDAGIPIPVSEIFNHPTVNDLAARLAGLLSAAPEAAVPGAPGRPAAGGPIAVVGAACRLPGGIADLDSYWRFLGDGRDAVVPIPAERWDRERYYDQDREKPGKMYTREAAFLTAPLDGFDSFFFMVSDQEASQMDPQQRLLLELAWEAFEQAGINPAALRGGDTAVFTALTESDYRQAHRASYRRGLIDAYSLTGTSSSGACGRLSYFFGFEGPCWSVDTACSSSLVALHCACGALRAGECGLALVASASLMLTPDLHICFSKLGAISPDGRSKSFDDLADGYGRGEGGAAVLLKRLADAERDGDDILGLILGSAVNQDGRSNGLTAPNGLAQRKVIDRALAAAGLSPLDISFVEAHGTGTALGDAIELDSLAAAYCRGRKREFPLRIGSVKANIGHLEPAAGLASLIKVLLCLRHRAIPANIHVKTPNSRFDFAGNAVEAPTALAAWESDPRDPAAPRRAGLSAFGFSGVNGHAIVGEYLPPPDPPGPGEGAEKAAPDPDQLFLPLSAKTPPALRELASRTAEMLRGLDARDAAALCRAMGAARPSFPCRLFGLGGDGRELAASLEGAEIAAPAAVSGPVLLFTGQGSQYPGMGKVLYELYPAFRVCLDSSFAILSRRGFNAGELLFGAASAADLEDTALAQPLIAAVSYALLRLWESFGLRCSAVLGHSIGEYPAAVAAGIMSQEDMLVLAEARGRIMRDAPAGAMAVVFASGEEVLPALAPTPEVVVAAVNSPRNLTLSGPVQALDSALAALGRKGIGCKRLRVSGAFHSPAMREAADRFADAFAGVKLGPPGGVAFISSLDGRVNPGDVASPDYWLRQILSPVRFADGLGAAAEFSRLALEVGPSAALTAIAGENAGAPEAVASLSPGQPALRTLFAAAGRLFRQGVDLDFAAVFSPFPRKRLRVPGYPFQRRSHWLPVVTDPPYASAVPASAAGSRRFSQALGPAALFESVFDSSGPYFVQEHVIFGQAISPAAGHLAMLLAAARDLWGETPVEIREADFLAPLVLGRGESRLVQIVIDNPDVEESRFKLVSAALDSSGRPAGGDVWRTHCTGLLSRRPAPRPPDAPADQCAALAPPADFGTPMAGADFYRRFTELGYDVGRGFQRIADIRVSGGEAICRVETRRNEDCEAGQVIYPGALDSILQTMMTSRLLELTGTMRKGESLFIPMRLERLTLWDSPPEAVLCFSNTRRGGRDSVMEGDALARDAGGRAVLEVAGCLTRQTNREAMLRELRRDGEGLLYHLLWREAPPVSAAAVKTGREAVACLRLGDGPPPPELARLPRAPETNIAAFLAGTDGKPVLVLAHLPGTARDAGREMREAAGLWRILRDCANASSPPRLHLLTRGLAAEADGPGETGGAGLAGASLPGLAASFALEHPGLLVSVIDLPLVPERGDYSRALDYCLSLGDALAEPASLALRRGKILSCRLAAAKPPRRTADVDYSGTHLVSGGTGALGLKTALWLAEHGAACLALLSRSGGSAGALAETAQRVRAAGCRLLTLKGDVSDEGDLRAALARVRAEAPPLRGVFHAAGARDDGLLINLSEERLLRVLRPKIQGAILLDRLTREDRLNFFVCYSSAGSLLGSGGQAAYNAANHFLNALCRARRRDGLAAAAPCFGPWAEGGMADDARVGANLRQQGIRPLSGGDALSAMFAGLAGPSAVYGIMDMDWPLFASRRNIDPRGFFSLAAARTPGPAAKPVEAGASAPIDFFAGARRADGGLDRAATLEGLRRQVASLLGQGDFTLIAPDKPIMDYGFDSLMAVRFSDAVGKALGLRVPVSVAFELPTLDKICAWLCAKAGQDQAAGPAEKTAPSPERLGPAKRPGWLSALFDDPP